MILRGKEEEVEYLGIPYQSCNFIPFHFCQMLLHYLVDSNKYSCGWNDSTSFFFPPSTFGNNLHSGCLKNYSSVLVFKYIILMLCEIFWVKCLVIWSSFPVIILFNLLP